MDIQEKAYIDWFRGEFPDLYAEYEDGVESAVNAFRCGFDGWKAAKASLVPYESCSIKSHEIIINETKKELIDGYDISKEDGYLLESLVYRGVCIGKVTASALPEPRSDAEIIKQTKDIANLIAQSQGFTISSLGLEIWDSENPRAKIWWQSACEIQELLTNTDPNNCDFDDYKATIEAREVS